MGAYCSCCAPDKAKPLQEPLLADTDADADGETLPSYPESSENNPDDNGLDPLRQSNNRPRRFMSTLRSKLSRNSNSQGRNSSNVRRTGLMSRLTGRSNSQGRNSSNVRRTGLMSRLTGRRAQNRTAADSNLNGGGTRMGRLFARMRGRNQNDRNSNTSSNALEMTNDANHMDGTDAPPLIANTHDTHPEGQPINNGEIQLLEQVKAEVEKMEGGKELVATGCLNLDPIVSSNSNSVSDTTPAAVNQELLMRMLRGVIENNPDFKGDKTKIVEAASVIVHRVMGWRQENDMDVVLDRLLPNHQEFHTYWPSMVCGCDASGHVIQSERLSDIDTKAICAMVAGGIKIEDIVYLRAQTLEMLDCYKRELGLTKGMTRYNHVCIIDLTGFSFGLMSGKMQEVLQPILQCGSDYCADSLAKIYLVNAPFSFRAAWAVISPWLHPVVRSKVNILGGKSSYTSAFDKAGIEPSSLPPYLQHPAPSPGQLQSSHSHYFLGKLIEARVNAAAGGGSTGAGQV